MKKIVVLISGKGSNLKSIIDACKQRINGKIVAVFSNKSSAYGLIYARREYIPTHVITENNKKFDYVLSKEIDVYEPDLIVLAGYMRILNNFFIDHYKGMILNIHPSLLPKYPGLNTHRKVLKNGDLEHGSSVHFVTEELDKGPIVIQSKINVFPKDDENSIIQRIKDKEHIIYPVVIKWFLEGRLIMKEKNAWLDGIKLSLKGYI
ncbi:phosphoribosylglycinamide formyltransferase [Candidatus Pantoea edessiphila]|uniref:Phosphoribosylglycinamide formyltransferase n=1 Tax=Candidatus Pantoea edessiphila TaxID=2044610 RepID=A0A2P5T112_9GAMM|nr:phosphoribosylglycinamide formyltransferase [Candidatus Pantoea edessiphila]PPI88256.1 phosphoribosylglycinamide formyltransferase [Candidatus Pantoea edessiphila]